MRPHTHIPKPFQRPGIVLGDTGAQKHWVKVPVEMVSTGDIVRGLGLVIERQWTEDNMRRITDFRLIFQNGKTERYAMGDSVIAFTAAEGDPVG